MHLRSLDGCRLAIGSYPHFTYNATNGGGKATISSIEGDDIFHLKFLPKDFSIPPLTYQTTKFLNLPLPPGLRIEMHMHKLEGSINKTSGEVLLNFESEFLFSICSILKFPELLVKTKLETNSVKSSLFTEQGHILQKNGLIKLVGIAKIPITTNKFLNFFLGLPNEALAILNCKIS